jgi:hypothetical protein
MRKRLWLWMLSALLLVAVVLALALNHRTTYREYRDPSGRYLVRISVKTFQSFVPMMPGSSSDKPCFVEIFDRNGESMGRIPVPMLQLVDMEWAPNGAEVKMIGGWDFDKGEYWYWSEDQTEKIVGHIRR